MKMCIHKYIPNSLYGFAIDEDGQQVFFHLGAFNSPLSHEIPARCRSCGKCTWGESSPPPILGETVLVDGLSETPPNLAPRAKSVFRDQKPVVVEGVVDVFDANRGFGFVRGHDNIIYHLHRSEMVDGRLPVPGHKVMFYAGVRQGKPRACHVKVCG